ncbi:MAG: PrgI family protein [Tissierellia bacterium]|nr:PrgI family protein [Tissierellia bacterium]
MRLFTVPFNIDNEDKIIGGYISIRQFFWLFIPIMFILYLFVINTGYLTKINTGNGFKIEVNHFKLVIRIIFSIISVIIGCILAFLKIDEVQSDKYFFNFIKFKSRKHIIKN